MLSSATTRCGLLLSSAIARGTLLGSPPLKTSRLPATFAAAFNGVCCFIGAGALGLSGQGCGAETGMAAGASGVAGWPGAVSLSLSTSVGGGIVRWARSRGVLIEGVGMQLLLYPLGDSHLAHVFDVARTRAVSETV